MQCRSRQRPAQRVRGGMQMPWEEAGSLSPGWSVMLIPFAPSKGENWRVRGIIHGRNILLSQFCYFFGLTFCSLLSLALCPAGSERQAGGAFRGPRPLHLLPHALAVAFGFVQVPAQTTLLISLVLQTCSLIEMLSRSLGDGRLFLCEHTRLRNLGAVAPLPVQRGRASTSLWLC